MLSLHQKKGIGGLRTASTGHKRHAVRASAQGRTFLDQWVSAIAGREGRIALRRAALLIPNANCRAWEMVWFARTNWPGEHPRPQFLPGQHHVGCLSVFGRAGVRLPAQGLLIAFTGSKKFVCICFRSTLQSDRESTSFRRWRMHQMIYSV